MNHIKIFEPLFSWETGASDFKLELEPTAGNYDQEFVDEWHAKLKSFSLALMKDIASYFDKAIP